MTFEEMMELARTHADEGRLEAAREIARDLMQEQLSTGQSEALRALFVSLNPREQVYQTAETFVTI